MSKMSRLKVKRKSEMWVSNNRVLLGLGSCRKDPGRNPNFDTEETKLLIALWGDPKIQKTLITTHRKHIVIAKLAEKMSEYGYNRSAEEINTRIKNLKCFYNRLKRDMELGINTSSGANWKHYKAMDEIMNRSVFSVRPNEIPKPSLRYQLEQQREMREMREKNLIEICKQVAEGKPSSTASGDEVKMDFTGSADDRSEDDLIEESDSAHMQCDGSVIIECEEKDVVGSVKIKEEDGLDVYASEIMESPLLIPKEEPVDDEEIQFESSTDDAKKKKPDPAPTQIPEFIEIPNNSNTITVSSNCCQLVNGTNLNNSFQTIPSPAIAGGITPSYLFANQANTIQAMPGMPGTGKISLVPTNFLLQNNTQPQQIQIRPQYQQRIICSQPNATTPTGIVTSTGAGKMKVLLVNAFQNGATTNVATANDGTFTNPNLITTGTVLNTNPTDQGIFKTSTEAPKQPKAEEGISAKDPGIEQLFKKLIVMQSENNEIQKQRLEVEQQRLEFEKSIADKLLAALTSLTQIPRPEYIIPTQAEESPQEEQCSKDQDEQPEFTNEMNGFQLLTPKIEKEDD